MPFSDEKPAGGQPAASRPGTSGIAPRSKAPTSTSQKPWPGSTPQVLWEAMWAVGGLIALIVGLILHSHYAGINRACSTGAGALGQAFSTTVHHDCSGASFLSSLGEILLWAGVFALIGGILGLIFSGSRGRFTSTGTGHS